MSESWQFVALCTWIICLLVATFLGYERGRWFTGLWLGLFFGPFGVIAAGFLLPSVGVEAERQHAVRRRMEVLARQDEAEARERRRSSEDLRAFFRGVEACQHADAAPEATPASASAAQAARAGSGADATLARIKSIPEPSAELLNGLIRGPKEKASDFATRLKQLASDLDALASSDAAHAPELRQWSRWLNVKADTARAMKRRSRSRF